MSPTIKEIRPIMTAPDGVNLVVVKLITSEPGLYGVGCATFTQRYSTVAQVVSEFLDPLLRNRSCEDIEEIFQLVQNNAYWRNGPILNNALSGVDMALWDIKGKLANMPIYSLLGGKCREAAAVYRHVNGWDLQELEDKTHVMLETGLKHIRLQRGGYGSVSKEQGIAEGKVGIDEIASPPEDKLHPKGAKPGVYYNPKEYTRSTLDAIAHTREVFGDRVEIIHDVHGRLKPSEAISFVKELEPLKLYFLEDPFAPEDSTWLDRVRQLTSTPIAMGELFNNSAEWTPLITGSKIDFMRMHVSQMGGITPAKKAAILGESFGVQTAWHGPADTSPVGHAANLHLDLCSPNFGIQEFTPFGEACEEIFPGCPKLEGGYLYPNNAPGLGIDIDEEAAAKYPCEKKTISWTQLRRPDGSLQRP